VIAFKAGCQTASNVIHSTTRIEIGIYWSGDSGGIDFECNPLNNKD